MEWNQHPQLEGTHAFLSASQCSWLNYDISKLVKTYDNRLAKEKGTELHEFASYAIKNRIKLLPKYTYPAVANFVNDAIGYGMSSEILLYYSQHAFGTADAIKYEKPNKRNSRGFLRIHDLKTGVIKPKEDQLKVYAALFFLEYRVKPENTDMELRIYQGSDIKYITPESEEIWDIIHTIKEFSGVLDNRPEY